jgi:hypothetical protein
MKMMKSTIIARSILVTVISVFFFSANSYSQEPETKDGDYIYLQEHIVSPQNSEKHTKWLKEFKAIADATGAPDYNVSSSDQGKTLFIAIGNSMAGYDEMNAKFGEWFKNNPEAGELEEKYGHTIDYSRDEVWRHSPLHSYTPEGYDNSISRPYSRVSTIYIRPNGMKEVNEVIKNFKAAYTEAGITYAVRAYWNVFGEEQACVAIVQSFENRRAWLDAEKEVTTKIDPEKLKDLQQKWTALQRKSVTTESWSRPALGHSN